MLPLLMIIAGATQAINVDSPTPRQIVQRGDDNLAVISVSGAMPADATLLDARLVPMPGGGGTAVDWQAIGVANRSFKGGLKAASGWYRLEIRAKKGETIVAESSVERVGVGEVFVIAGQSNSANHGTTKFSAREDRVSVLGEKGWMHAEDPLPIATGTGGSPWTILGDLLVKKLNVPVGFISVGVGGTSTKQWQPGGKLYPRLNDALKRLGKGGARAVLWHQGESDTIAGTSADEYAELLGNIIRQSRADAGYDIQWFVAGVSFIREQHAAKQPPIREGQKKVCDGKLTFPGPETDDLHGEYRAPDTVHFSGKGLEEHAKRWANVLGKTLFKSRPGQSPPAK